MIAVGYRYKKYLIIFRIPKTHFKISGYSLLRNYEPPFCIFFAYE
ncbi:hypothetical protein HMPREF9389_1674 [Streptococcus sanguinis SK355]|uniref:Uncharacterized protein n=1 Tax=Streptococcus sanguinis SK355 TaxID=888816 RepID=F3US66_STRSA|nr:hypothetical protein HMPREF9389_1674 [Streptococcus sanguinis SK355]